MIIGDNEYKGYVELIMDLDWADYDLWLVGGILTGKDTQDIDAVIVGPHNPERVLALIEECKKMGPWDINYQSRRPLEDPYMKRIETVAVNRSKKRCRNLLGPGLHHEGLCWLKIEIPSLKMQERRDRTYKAPRLLIQNGEQIYLEI